MTSSPANPYLVGARGFALKFGSRRSAEQHLERLSGKLMREIDDRVHGSHCALRESSQTVANHHHCQCA